MVNRGMSVCVCARMCVHACMRVCMCVCVHVRVCMCVWWKYSHRNTTYVLASLDSCCVGGFTACITGILGMLRKPRQLEAKKPQ